MGFYLRKSFRMGPIRFNLSKSGLGASIGVTGARIGITSRGRAYVHAGRGGLYFRQSLGGSGRAPAAGAGLTPVAEPITLYEDTGVTYPGPVDEPGRAAVERLVPRPAEPDPWPYLLTTAMGLTLAVAGLAIAGGSARLPFLVVGLGLVTIGLIALRRTWAERRARIRLRSALAPAISDGRPLRDDELDAARRALDDPALADRGRRAELEQACLDATRRIVEDGGVTPRESELLAQLEAGLGLDPAFGAAARTDAFRGLYLQAVADHDLTESEERSLAELRRALRIPDDALAAELAVLDRLAELRAIRHGELPIVEPGVPLPEGETCHFADVARLLRERNLHRFQRQGQQYRVRGLTIHREGTLLITNRRLLLLHTGTTSVPLDRILDLEVDMDRNLLRLVRDGAATPMLITTPDAVRAGAVLAAITGL